MTWLYQIALHLAALFFLTKKKYWKRISARLGRGFPRIEKGERKLIWVHAVSLGETRAIAPLIKKWKSQPNPPLILLSTATETGFAEGERLGDLIDFHVYLPWDFSYVIRPIVRKVCPDLVILTETDFWMNFQEEAKRQGAKVALVNGKLSSRSYERLLRLPFVAKWLFQSVDLFCVQNESYGRRFSALGVDEKKIVVTGNLKLDGFHAEEGADDWRALLGIRNGDLVMTCGSTHDPEEKILLEAVKVLTRRFPTLKVLLVPRHPERFNAVEELLEKEKLPFARLSKMGASSKPQVILVDRMGHLRKCYQISHLAFVGGSFAPKVGGHNILEPAYYGVPVLFGPYMQGQPDFLDLVATYHAGEQVKEETLIEVLDRFLEDADLRKKLGENGKRLILEGQGALGNTWDALLLLHQNKEVC